MISTAVLQLLDSKQVWELSDKELVQVKRELLRLNSKLTTEQNFRLIAEGSDKPLAEQYVPPFADLEAEAELMKDFAYDTPLAESYGG